MQTAPLCGKTCSELSENGSAVMCYIYFYKKTRGMEEQSRVRQQSNNMNMFSDIVGNRQQWAPFSSRCTYRLFYNPDSNRRDAG